MGKKDRKQTDDALKKKAKKGAHRVWLAGLGALAAAESEGNKLFHNLVAKGEELESRGKPVAKKLSKRAEKARKAAEAKAAQVSAEAKDAWDKVESLLEEKVQSAIESRGYVARDEVDALHAKIEALKSQLATAKKPARKPAAKKVAAKKPATKTTAAKKTVAKKATAKKTTGARKPAKKAAKRTTTRNPAAKKTTARKPAAKKTTAATKPAAKKTTGA